MQHTTQKTLFYSWQSDLPSDSNQKGIRYCLETALAEFNSEAKAFTLTLDEATSREAGSPEIPATIFSKITASDIFVCDISTINSTDATKRKTPNPNVLIELGFAISTLGWKRIIMLFNKEYGNFPIDLPFDLDKRRVTTYTIKNKNDKSGKGTLSSILRDAVNAISEENPPKPHQSSYKSIEQIHRERDVKNIRALFSEIDITAIDSFIENLPEMITKDSFHYHYSFKSIYDSNTFFLHNIDIRDQLEAFTDLWNRTLSYASYFSSNHLGEAVFYIPGDTFPSATAEKAFLKLSREASELSSIFKKLIKSIREQYHEIELDELSSLAAAAYKAQMAKSKARNA